MLRLKGEYKSKQGITAKKLIVLNRNTKFDEFKKYIGKAFNIKSNLYVTTEDLYEVYYTGKISDIFNDWELFYVFSSSEKTNENNKPLKKTSSAPVKHEKITKHSTNTVEYNFSKNSFDSSYVDLNKTKDSLKSNQNGKEPIKKHSVKNDKVAENNFSKASSEPTNVNLDKTVDETNLSLNKNVSTNKNLPINKNLKKEEEKTFQKTASKRNAKPKYTKTNKKTKIETDFPEL